MSPADESPRTLFPQSPWLLSGVGQCRWGGGGALRVPPSPRARPGVRAPSCMGTNHLSLPQQSVWDLLFLTSGPGARGLSLRSPANAELRVCVREVLGPVTLTSGEILNNTQSQLLCQQPKTGDGSLTGDNVKTTCKRTVPQWPHWGSHVSLPPLLTGAGLGLPIEKRAAVGASAHSAHPTPTPCTGR